MRRESQAERVVIGIDLHPDSFAAVALSGPSAAEAKMLFQHTKQNNADWESWLRRHVDSAATLVMEAGNNSFEFAASAERLGFKSVILESKSEPGFLSGRQNAGRTLSRLILGHKSKSSFLNRCLKTSTTPVGAGLPSINRSAKT